MDEHAVNHNIKAVEVERGELFEEYLIENVFGEPVN